MSRASTRTLRIGAIGVVISFALMVLPLILPRNSINRFLVAIGFIGLCWSLSCLVNGVWDWLRDRRNP
jgi:4-hydroxybenzoate polyprenyltransferase